MKTSFIYGPLTFLGLTLLVTCPLQAQDVYNFYFQKAPGPQTVTQGGSGQKTESQASPQEDSEEDPSDLKDTHTPLAPLPSAQAPKPALDNVARPLKTELEAIPPTSPSKNTPVSNNPNSASIHEPSANSSSYGHGAYVPIETSAATNNSGIERVRRAGEGIGSWQFGIGSGSTLIMPNLFAKENISIMGFVIQPARVEGLNLDLQYNVTKYFGWNSSAILYKEPRSGHQTLVGSIGLLVTPIHLSIFGNETLNIGFGAGAMSYQEANIFYDLNTMVDPYFSVNVGFNFGRGYGLLLASRRGQQHEDLQDTMDFTLTF